MLRLSARQIRRLKRLGASIINRRKRRDFSRSDLLDYLRKNNLRSWRKLEAFRNDGDPFTANYRGEFGSWSEAVRSAFGSQILKPGVDKEYLTRAALTLGIRTYRQYVQARKKNPHMLPSVYVVVKEFESFDSFMSDVREMSFKDTLEAYRMLWRRLGKTPTLEDCGIAGIVLKVLMGVFEDKDGLDSWMKYLDKTGRKNERQRRGA